MTDSLDDGTCYDYSGFQTNVKCNNFDFNKSNYSLSLLYEIEGKEYLVKTNKKIRLREDE